MTNKHKAAIRADLKIVFDNITKQRDEILKAFIAQHQCLPDEVEQVTKVDPRTGEVIYFVRKKNDAKPN